MPYCELFYHIVWSTKDRQPLITADNESIVHNYVRVKAVGLKAMVFAVNGISDHIHMVASVPPTIELAKFIGQVKGASSANFNKSGFSDTRLYWQGEYGLFSFDRKRLPRAEYLADFDDWRQEMIDLNDDVDKPS